MKRKSKFLLKCLMVTAQILIAVVFHSAAEKLPGSGHRAVIYLPQSNTLITVQGHVTDETGNPLSGATLTVKWTEREILSDQNGEFKIENVTEKDTIVVNRAGYQTTQFRIERSKLNYFITLKTKGNISAREPAHSPNGSTMNITGKVYDDKGEPLPDAILVVKGQNQGGFTNTRGEFSLTQIPANSKIVLSHINFFSEEFTVNGSQVKYSITLRKNPTRLSEVTIEGFGPSHGVAKIRPYKTSEKILGTVEQDPEFPGGQDALYKYLAQNIRYPAEASEANWIGKVLVSFTVNENGKIRNPQIIKPLGWGMDEEVLRAVLNMPKWTPAIQNGKSVSKEFTLSINFELK